MKLKPITVTIPVELLKQFPVEARERLLELDRSGNAYELKTVLANLKQDLKDAKYDLECELHPKPDGPSVAGAREWVKELEREIRGVEQKLAKLTK